MRSAFRVATLAIAAAAATAAFDAPAAPAQVSARISLRWKAVAGASGYELEIARDPAFRDVVLRQRTTVPGFRWDELPRAKHYWRVRSYDAEMRPGDWSEAETIQPAVGAPEPASPRPNAVVLAGASFELDLAAHASPLLREYIFEVSADPNFGSGVQVRRSASAAARFPLDRPGIFYWRVRGVDLSGRDAGASEIQKVEVRLGPPEVEAPPDLAQFPWRDGAPPVRLSWKNHPHARTYEVEITQGGAKRVQKVDRNEFELPVKAPSKVSWRVAGVDAAGRRTPFSAPRSFGFQVPGPTLAAPAASARVRVRTPDEAVRFSWQLPSAATGAEVQIARDPAFAQVLVRQKVSGTKFETKLPVPGNYHWRAAAFGPPGLSYGTSEAASFQLAPAEPPAAPQLSAPAADAVFPDAASPVRVAWAPVDGARRYEVSLDGGAPAASLGAEQLLGGLGEGEHAVRVRAVDDLELQSAWSEPIRFHVGVPLTVRAEVDLGGAPLVADGAAMRSLYIRLYDARGRVVRGVTPTVAASAGEVRAVEPDGDGFRAEYVAPYGAPDGGAAEIRVAERAFQTSAQLALAERPFTVHLSARAGWSTAFSAMSSPFVGIEAAVEPGWVSPRLVLSLRAGFHGGAVTRRFPQIVPEISTQTRVVPVLAVGWWRALTGPLEVRFGVGGGVHVAHSWSGGQSETVVAPAGTALVGGSRVLGPGRLHLEVGYELARIDGAIASGRTGGLLTTVGYGVDL